MTGHYSCPHRSHTVIQIDRITGQPAIRKYHYQRYGSLPRTDVVHFARHSPLPVFTSTPVSGVSSHPAPYKNKAKQFLAYPHSGSPYPTRPVCVDHIQLSRYIPGFCLHFLDKSMSGLSIRKAHKTLTPAVGAS